MKRLQVILGSMVLVLAVSAYPPLARGDTLAYEAYTEYPVKTSGTVNAGGVSWHCAGFKCQAEGFGSLGVSQCKALAAKIGYVGSFAWGGSQLSAAQLDACNAGIAMGSEISPPSPQLTPSEDAVEPAIEPAAPVTPTIAPVITRHRYSARTKTALDGARRATAGGLRFDCSPRGDCRAEGPASGFTVQTCKSLAAQVGPLAAFSRDNRPMNAARMAQCNQGLRFAYVAEFDRPVKHRGIDVPGGRWQCAGRSCRITTTWEAPTVAYCKALADRAGAEVTRFSRDIGGSLDPGALVQCNRSAGLVAVVVEIESTDTLAPQTVIAGVPWTCRRTQGRWECTGQMSRQAFLAGFNIGTCRQLAARLGPVVVFEESEGDRTLAAAQLDQCNRSARDGLAADGANPPFRIVDETSGRRGIGGALVRNEDGSGYGVATQPLTAGEGGEYGVLRQAMFGTQCRNDRQCGTGRCREGICAPEDGEGRSPWELGDSSTTDYCHHDNHCRSKICLCDNPDHKDGAFCRSNGQVTPGKCSPHRGIALGGLCSDDNMCSRDVTSATQCVQGKCAPEDDTGLKGMYCHHNNHCLSGRCVGNQCQAVAALGQSCKKDKHCRGGNRAFWDRDWTARCERERCVPRDYLGDNGDFCQHDNQCTSLICAQGRCLGGALPLGAKCKKEEQCAGGNRAILGNRWTAHCPQGRCAPRDKTGDIGSYCHHDNHCTQGLRCKCPGRGRYGERFLNGVCIRTDDPSDEQMSAKIKSQQEFVCRI